MPRATRNVLSKRDPNAMLAATADAMAAPGTKKPLIEKRAGRTVAFADQSAAAKTDAEVDDLRAQVADLTAKLERASLSAAAIPPTTTTAATSAASEPVAPRNPFGGAMPSITPLPFIALSSTGPPPKRPATAYHAFVAANRDGVREKQPQLPAQLVMAELARLWNDALPSVKADFEGQVREDRERYASEKKLFDERVAGVQEEKLAIEFMRKRMTQQRALRFYELHGAPGGITDAAAEDAGVPDVAADVMKEEEAEVELKKPKKPRSAYIFYTMLRHEQLAGVEGGEKLTDFTSTIADEWKTLQTSRKKKDKVVISKCGARADEDRTRYADETHAFEEESAARETRQMERHSRLRAEAVRQFRAECKTQNDLKEYKKLMADKKTEQRAEKSAARAAKAESNEPKRARTAYMFFFKEKAKDAALRSKCDADKTSVAAAVGALWKAASDADKIPYVEQAQADVIRHKEELAAMKMAAMKTAQ